MRLDVGCGHNAKGDVNVDLYLEATSHRSIDQNRCDDTPLDTGRIPNLVCADAMRLPFRPGVFDEVVSNHVIEHVPDPSLILREMVRVLRSGGGVEVVCPHRFASRRGKPLHRNSLNKGWFAAAFRRLGVTITHNETSGWRYFPHPFVPLVRLPTEITVRGEKRA